ncbi:unnamed protein product [Calypogeia fissa]
MLSPARSTISFDSTDGGVEFGAPALQGYTFTLNEPVGDWVQEANSVQSLGSRAMACFPEFVVNAAGGPGLDGVHGEHGTPGLNGADGAHGKDGYGPGRPGKPGKPGKDGKPGTAGKKGKKGTNGTSGGRARNVLLSLSGEGLESVTVSGHFERVVKVDEAQQDSTESAVPDDAKPAINETVLQREPLNIVHRLNTYPNQRPLPELDDLDNLNRESSVLITPEGPHGAPLNFFTRRGVVLVRAHGGRGGNGGNGGNGGYGADGGSGGNGGKGGDGKKGMKPGWNGENGGRGGDGGAGMAGGAGGDGCPAGKGGNAGTGGRVTIETKTAKLLMLVETDARQGSHGEAGRPGVGGEGGMAGKGGLGGHGGLGGPPWDKLWLQRHHKYKYYRNCYPGIDGAGGGYGGMIGPKHAPNGMPGSVAPNGKEGKDGQVTWILKSADGEIMEKAKDRFNCAVCQFRVRAGSGIGIISPGSTITIDKVIVWNNGGMTLPEGTRLSFTGTGVLSTSSKDMKKVEILPEIRKNKRYKCASTFSMAVEKLDGPAGGSPFQALISLMPSIELCGRNFSVRDQVLEVPVQFPIQIVGDVQFPHTVHQGSTTTLQFNVRNISSRSYGQGKRSLGTVEARVMFFLELELGQRVERKWTKEVSEIGAGQDQLLQFDCRVDTNGQPYSILSVQVHLLLKGQSIEYRHLESRIIPVYRATEVDAVIVTDTDFKPGVYNLWTSILALLGLKCVFWDISWYQTYSIEDVPWIGKHRLVIFTLWLDDNSLSDWLMSVLPHHVRALGGPAGIDNAGAIFVGPTSKDIARELVDWSNGEKLQDVTAGGLFVSCVGGNMTTDDGVRRAVFKASKLQKKVRARDSSSQEDYTCHVSPVQRLGHQSIPLVLFRETLPALFRSRAISVQMIEDPAGVELLASSPLLSTQDATGDIYSGISTAIGGLITSQQSYIAPSFRQQTSVRLTRSIALDGRYITLGLTLAGLIVALPIQFRVDVLFRLARYACTDLPVLSSSGIALTEVIAISFYNDLKSDWLTQRDSFPHGRTLVAEFDRAASIQGYLNVVDIEAFVVAITGGVVVMIDDMKGLSRRKVRAKTRLKDLLKKMHVTLGFTNSVYTPRAEKIRMDYKSLQRTLPPWLFSFEDELQVIRVLDDHGTEAKK